MSDKTGGCLCGQVRYRITSEPVVSRMCWCRDCQYLGAGSGTVGACFRTATFKVVGKTSDFTSVADSGSRMHRRFCPDCGTGLFYTNAAILPRIIDIQSATYHDPEGVPAQVHIQVAERLGWMKSVHELPTWNVVSPTPSR